MCCHALLFSIAVAGIKQEINENKDAKGAFRYELIKLPPELRLFLYSKAAKITGISLLSLLLHGHSAPLFSFLSPMYEWTDNLQGSVVLAGVKWRETGGIFLPSQSNILH